MFSEFNIVCYGLNSADKQSEPPAPTDVCDLFGVAQHVPRIGFWPALRAPTAAPRAPPQRKRKLNVFIRKCKVNSIIIIVFTFALRGAVGPGLAGQAAGRRSQKEACRDRARAWSGSGQTH